MSIIDIICSGNGFGGILISVLLVILVHQRDVLLGFLRSMNTNGSYEFLISLVLRVLDLLRAYYHIGCEHIRSILAIGPDSGMGLRSQQSGMGYRKLTQPPPLVVLANETDVVEDTTKAEATVLSSKRSPSPSESSGSSIQMQQPSLVSRELEPAFLNDKDYPPGWLVYHPTLGVVEKDVADTFNLQIDS